MVAVRTSKARNYDIHICTSPCSGSPAGLFVRNCPDVIAGSVNTAWKISGTLFKLFFYLLVLMFRPVYRACRRVAEGPAFVIVVRAGGLLCRWIKRRSAIAVIRNVTVSSNVRKVVRVVGERRITGNQVSGDCRGRIDSRSII